MILVNFFSFAPFPSKFLDIFRRLLNFALQRRPGQNGQAMA